MGHFPLVEKNAPYNAFIISLLDQLFGVAYQFFKLLE